MKDRFNQPIKVGDTIAFRTSVNGTDIKKGRIDSLVSGTDLVLVKTEGPVSRTTAAYLVHPRLIILLPEALQDTPAPETRPKPVFEDAEGQELKAGDTVYSFSVGTGPLVKGKIASCLPFNGVSPLVQIITSFGYIHRNPKDLLKVEA